MGRAISDTDDKQGLTTAQRFPVVPVAQVEFISAVLVLFCPVWGTGR
jgi:hypothetical protein